MILIRIVKQYQGIKFTAAFENIAAGQVLRFEQSMQFSSQFVDIIDVI